MDASSLYKVLPSLLLFQLVHSLNSVSNITIVKSSSAIGSPLYMYDVCAGGQVTYQCMTASASRLVWAEDGAYIASFDSNEVGNSKLLNRFNTTLLEVVDGMNFTAIATLTSASSNDNGIELKCSAILNLNEVPKHVVKVGPPQEVVRLSASMVSRLLVRWEAPNNCTVKYEVQLTSTQSGCPALNDSTSLTSMLFDIPMDCNIRNYTISVISTDLEETMSKPVVISPMDIDADACPKVFTVSVGIVCSDNGTSCTINSIGSTPESDIKIDTTSVDCNCQCQQDPPLMIPSDTVTVVVSSQCADPIIDTSIVVPVLAALLLVIVALLILVGILATLLTLEKRKNSNGCTFTNCNLNQDTCKKSRPDLPLQEKEANHKHFTCNDVL